jgi:tricorn protease
MCKIYLLITWLLFTCLFAAAQNRFPFQMPTASDKQIAFVYAGEIWIVERNGGAARKLVNQAGDKVTPVFSPDGAQVAFSMNAGGNLDVYVIAATGGQAKRLTYHPKEDAVAGWTPDGKHILFRSRRITDSTHQLYTISAQGGFEKQLPLPIAWDGSYSPDASHIAYTPLSDPTRAWRNYRGGQTSAIWIADLASSQTQAIPRNNSNDRTPMWVGNKIYFISDRTNTANLFAYHTQTKKTDQLTRFDKYDIRSVSYGGGAIVFVQDGAIHLYDLQSNQEHTLSIKIADTDFAETRQRSVKAARWIRAFNLSPDGRKCFICRAGRSLKRKRRQKRGT